VCDALDAAHEQSVVHRDLKPENLFLVGDPARPTVKVIDFGISKHDDGLGGAGLTKTGIVMGTPAYMAPEQARGDKVDSRADIYALGAILYRILTGQTPFSAEDTGTALTAVLTEEPARPRSIAPELPEAIEMVVERAMSKDPAKRYQSMAELGAALAPFDTQPSPLDLAVSPTTHGERVADARAATILAASSAQSSDDVLRSTRQAKLARPAVVILSMVAVLGILAGAADTIASTVMLVWPDRALGGLDATLIVAGLVATGVTPLVLWIRWIAKRVWGSTVRAVGLSRTLAAATLWGLATYGTLALVVRVGLDVAQRTPRDIASPMWGPLLFVAAIAAATIAGAVTRATDRAA
jgi:serine/threonine-protein kinase